MLEILEWVFFIYSVGFIFKFIMNYPLARKMPEYYEEAYGEGSCTNKMFIRAFPLVLTAIVWPYLLMVERLHFFWARSEAENREFFVRIWKDIKHTSEQV